MVVDLVLCLELLDVFGGDIDGIDGTDRHEDDGLLAKPNLLEVALQLLFDVDESLGTPIYSVHLVHRHYELVNAKGLDYVRVLLGLSSADEGRLEVISVDDQDGIVGLGCARDHVGNEVSVARRVKEYDVLAAQLDLLDSYIDCYSSCPLLLRRVSHPRMLEGLLADLLRLLFVLVHFLLIQVGSLLQEYAHQR